MGAAESRRPWGWVRWVVVALVLLVVAAGAIVMWVHARIVANERGAMGALDDLASANEGASHMWFNGRYWAHDVAGLYFMEGIQSPIDVEDDFAKFLHLAITQADVARGKPLPPVAGCTWEYDSPALSALPHRAFYGYVFRSHSSAQAGLVRGVGAGYRIVACPVRYGLTGRNCYVLDEAATTHRRRWDGARRIDARPESAPLLETGILSIYPGQEEQERSWEAVGD